MVGIALCALPTTVPVSAWSIGVVLVGVGEGVGGMCRSVCGFGSCHAHPYRAPGAWRQKPGAEGRGRSHKQEEEEDAAINASIPSNGVWNSGFPGGVMCESKA